MSALIKRDKAILEYLVYHYGKERVIKEMTNIQKDIQRDSLIEKIKNKIQ